jgi:hypothetical protein
MGGTGNEDFNLEQYDESSHKSNKNTSLFITGLKNAYHHKACQPGDLFRKKTLSPVESPTNTVSEPLRQIVVPKGDLNVYH